MHCVECNTLSMACIIVPSQLACDFVMSNMRFYVQLKISAPSNKHQRDYGPRSEPPSLSVSLSPWVIFLGSAESAEVRGPNHGCVCAQQQGWVKYLVVEGMIGPIRDENTPKSLTD